MIEKKIERGHEKRADGWWAYTEETFNNGDDNPVIRKIEERVTKDQVRDILDHEIPEAQGKHDEEFKLAEKNVKIDKKRLDQYVNKREYVEFKKELKTEDFVKMNKIYNIDNTKDIGDISFIIEAAGLTKEYDAFKARLQEKAFKQHYLTLQDESKFAQLERQLEIAKKKRDQHEGYKQQFVALYKDMCLEEVTPEEDPSIKKSIISDRELTTEYTKTEEEE